jgi:hypothetical protein
VADDEGAGVRSFYEPVVELEIVLLSRTQ